MVRRARVSGKLANFRLPRGGQYSAADDKPGGRHAYLVCAGYARLARAARCPLPSGTGFVPFLAATTGDSFERLLSTAEHLSRERGKTALLTRASSSSWNIVDALDRRGYHAEALTSRIKAGDHPDYDHTSSYYLDSWL